MGRGSKPTTEYYYETDLDDCKRLPVIMIGSRLWLGKKKKVITKVVTVIEKRSKTRNVRRDLGSFDVPPFVI